MNQRMVFEIDPDPIGRRPYVFHGMHVFEIRHSTRCPHLTVSGASSNPDSHDHALIKACGLEELRPRSAVSGGSDPKRPARPSSAHEEYPTTLTSSHFCPPHEVREPRTTIQGNLPEQLVHTARPVHCVDAQRILDPC